MRTIFIIGDSTVENGSAPFFGWGGQLARCLADDRVENHAIGGRSSRSFWEEGRFGCVAERMAPGDLLLIAFGHNDEKDDPPRHTDPETTFPAYLTRYIDAARSRGATPVLCTSAERNYFVGDEVFLMYTHGAYPYAARLLARRLCVPLIDLEARTRALMCSLGPEGAGALFVRLAPGEHPDHPEGHIDKTHFNLYGARKVAGVVARELCGLGLIRSTDLKEELA